MLLVIFWSSVTRGRREEEPVTSGCFPNAYFCRTTSSTGVGGSSTVPCLWPSQVLLHLLTAKSGAGFSKVRCSSVVAGSVDHMGQQFWVSVALRTCPGRCPVPGSLRAAAALPSGLATAPAAELSLCSSTEVLAAAPNCKCSSDAQPSTWLPASPSCSPCSVLGLRGGLGAQSCSSAAPAIGCPLAGSARPGAEEPRRH